MLSAHPLWQVALSPIEIQITNFGLGGNRIKVSEWEEFELLRVDDRSHKITLISVVQAF